MTLHYQAIAPDATPTLHVEQISLAQLAAQYGTPLYVYSHKAISNAYLSLQSAFGDAPHLICFAVKANSNLAVLNLLATLGAGFDIVSGGELARVLAAGGSADRVIFSGTGKTDAEIISALTAGIHCFNVESVAELATLNRIAASMDCIAPISLRINPDVDAMTHPYISTGLKENKFGIGIEHALAVYQQAATLSHIQIKGIDCHIGSQLLTAAPFLDAIERLLQLVDQLATQGIHLTHFDFGGGMGIRYQQQDQPIPLEPFIAQIKQRLGTRALTLITEPGRLLVGEAGVLLTQVILNKSNGDKQFAVVDTAMNDLIRPALYQAWMDIVPVTPRTDLAPRCVDVVGPICESSDFLGQDRQLAVLAGDLLAIKDAGAYSFTMSSNYNSRPRAAEVMVRHDRSYVVRRREKTTDLFAHESLLP